MPIVSNPPPSHTAKTSSAKSSQTKASQKKADQREGLEGIAQLGAFALICTRRYADAGAITLHAPKLVSEVVDLAEKNEKVAQGLAWLTQAGPYAGVVAAGLPLVLQLMVNHGQVQPGVMGTVSGAVLEAQVKTELAKQEQEAIRAQQEAEASLQALQELRKEQQFYQENYPEGVPA